MDCCSEFVVGCCCGWGLCGFWGWVCYCVYWLLFEFVGCVYDVEVVFVGGYVCGFCVWVCGVYWSI